MSATSRSRLARWLAPAFFAAAAAAVLLPSMLGLDPIYGFDTVQEKYFWRTWAYARLLRGEWPWWCAGLVGGFPLIAEPITQFWYPPVAALHLLFPIGRALNLTWWLHLAWAGLGMFHLLGRRGLAAPAATLGGLAYGLSVWMVGHVPMGGLPHLASCAWAPWLIAALLRLVEATVTPRPRDVAVAAVTVAASLLAGHAQFVYGALLFLTIFALLSSPTRASSSSTGESRVSLEPRLLAALLALGLGAGLAATMIVPYAELLAASNRGAALAGEFADFGARLPPAQLLGTFAPGFFGGSGDVPYWGFPTREAVTPYFGVVPLALALSPVPRRARREAWALRAVGVLGLLLAMGPSTPFLGWLRDLAPLLDRARHPARWLELTMLAGSWLAAWGAQLVLERTGRESGPPEPRDGRSPSGAGLAIVAILAVCTWWTFSDRYDGPSRYAGLVASGLDDSALTDGDGLRIGNPDALDRARSLSTMGCRRALVYCAVALGLVAAARLARQRHGAAWALVGLTAIDLVSQGRREIISFDRSALPWPSELTQAAARAAPDARIATAFPGADFPFPARFRDSHAILSRIGQADMHRTLLAGATSPQGGIPTTPTRWLRLALGDGSYDFNDAPVGPRTVVDRLSIGLLVTAPGTRPAGAGWQRVHADAQRWLWRNTRAVSRASLVHRCVSLGTQGEVLGVLRDPRLERPGGVAFMAGPCPAGIDDPGAAGSPGEAVRWLEAADERLVLEVRTGTGALLRLADGAMPGWRATVDGDPVPIEIVDFALRGVVVPAGTHRVEFHYRPTAAWLGLCLSAAALLAIFLLLSLPGLPPSSAAGHARRHPPLTDG